MALAPDLTDVEVTRHDAAPAHASPVEVPLAAEAISRLETLDPEKHYEFVNDCWEEKPMAGARHGGVVIRLSAELWLHVREHHLGGVYSANTTFTIGNNQRLPDIAFVRNERIPADGEPEGIWPIAPDLAIEVISPNDLYNKVMEKTADYLNAGVTEVWLVAPALRMMTVYRDLKHPQVFLETETLEGSEVLTGFKCVIASLFISPARR